MNHLWFDFESIIANAFHNWENVRSYDPISRIERRPGFTESWGTSSDDDHSELGSRAATPPLGWAATIPTPPTTTTQKSTSQSLPTIVQFRPAWAVQLALRASGMDHKVINSSYAVTEACGPLPYLRNETALVGGSSHKILKYLVETKQVELAILDSNSTHVKVASTEEPLSIEMIQELITETLVDILTILRYQDRHTWKAVERPRSLRAVHGNWFIGHWHVWAERHIALSSLHRQLRTVEQAKAKAHRAYVFLEKALQTSPQIFLHRKFSVAGLVLFEHIMHALADSHLVTILHHYPLLCQYGQNVWEEYFAEETCQITVAKEAAVINAQNPFFVLPAMDTWKAVVPMSTDDSSWQERLATLARETAASVKPRPVLTTVTPDDATTSHLNTESAADAAVTAYQTADQRWIASVLLVAIVAITRTIRQARDVQGEAA